MAHESRLTAFEQALKDEGIKGTNLEPVARSIFQQESSSGANVKTSNAGARGPMQVLPATFKAYNPQGNIDNPYDNSVGGLRYIKDLFNKTGDLGLTAVGYYGGPKAIEKAKQGVAVSDPRNPNAPNTLQYMEQVMGRTKGAPAGKQQRPAVPKTIKQVAPELGPNYQAALALMAKADDLSEAREKIAEEEEAASAGADFSQARQMLSQIQPISGFAAQEPRRMADGGLASAANLQRPTLTSQDKAKQTTLQQQLKEYEEKAKSYNEALEKYNTEIYNPYKIKTDEYNRAADEYNKAVEAARNAPEQIIATRVVYGPAWLRGGYIPYGARGPGERRDMPTGGVFRENAAYRVGGVGDIYIPGAPMPDPFTLTAPTAPDPFNLTAPTAPTTQEEINKFLAEAQARAKQNATRREMAMKAIQAPGQFNIGSFGLGDVSGFAGTSTQLFSDGGEAKKPEPGMGEKLKGTAKEVLRSMQYAPYDLLGAPVDIGNLALKGVDYVTGSKLATEKPVGGSEYLIQKSRELGIADEPTGSTTETLTRLGTGIVSPTAGPRAVIAAGKAAKGTAKAALEDLAMAGTGQGGSKLAQKIMEPGTAFAVRPKGGVSLGAASAADVPLTRIDEELKRTIEGIDTSTEQGKEIAKFFDKKVRNFYQNQYGTPDDPLFKAILQNRIQPSLGVNPQVIAAARAGDPNAIRDLRNSYDASTNVEILSSRSVLDKLGKHPFDMEGDVRKLIKQQNPDETTLMTGTGSLNQKELEKYPALYAPKGFQDIVAEGEAGSLLRIMNQSNLPPHVRQAVVAAEPIYGTTGGMSRMLPANDIRDYLLTRTPAEIKNMGVIDVAVKSREWHRMLSKAANSPENFSKKELFAGTSPVMKLEKDSWVDVKTPEALAIEGCIMGHCVGRLPSYAQGVQEGTTKIFSLRDNKGVPHVTMQVLADSDGVFNNIAQVKGTANTAPEKYYPQIDQFLTNYSETLKKPLRITESPVDRDGVPFLPENWRYK